METTESMEHDGFIKAVSSQERDEKVSLLLESMANLKVATRSFQMREEELKERIHRLESVALQEPPQNP